MTVEARSIRLVILDWAGTTVDFGCFGPVAPFVDSLASRRISVTSEQVRRFMGLTKIDHLRSLFGLPEVTAQWQEVHGRSWDEPDVARVYEEVYLPALLESVGQHSRIVPGLLDVVDTLQAEGIKLATTTGYGGEAASIVFEAARRQGYAPVCNVLPDDVPQGRPEPWMIRRAMKLLDIDSPTTVVKVGDTPVDIAEGINAGVWSVGIIATSSEVGLSEADWNDLSEGDRRERTEVVRKRLMALGAHACIETLAELPGLIRTIDRSLSNGSGPQPIQDQAI